ncbi:MAG TPA: trehalose-phosphatase [Anaeromyxobacteraceae bacterium]|nr:trehalose-phosphatase [Anaeromyxobacteraceae bacterium]
MKPLFSAEGAAVVDDIARDRTFLAFDFDGTLAPIVDERSEAQMRPETLALLRATALLYPCAVISGRARADVAARVADVPLAAIVGNHGAEAGFGPLDRELVALVRTWADELQRTLAGAEGVEIEDKRFSIALHYRRARSWQDAERVILAATASLQGATAFGGHAVVNVVPAGAPTKGDALRALCARNGTSSAMYVGDDSTDEEAFRSEVVGTSIRVGENIDSAAQYFVPDQAGIDELLRQLIAGRTRHDGLGDRSGGIVRAVRR